MILLRKWFRTILIFSLFHWKVHKDTKGKPAIWKSECSACNSLLIKTVQCWTKKTFFVSTLEKVGLSLVIKDGMKCLDDFSQMGGFAGSWAHVFCPLSLCKFTSFSHCISLSVMFYSLWPPWTVTYQALLFMGFSRQGYWSGLPFPSPGDLPNLGIKPGSPAWQVDSLPSEPPRKFI